MRALLYEKFQGPIELRTLPDPAPPADGVVIRVQATGLCRSDWHGWMGHDPDIRLPHVPGHELAGTIEAIGPEVRRWHRGQRVTVPFAVGCGSCPQCDSGNEQICDRYFQPGFTAWGSFAQFVAIPHADLNLVGLPEDLGFLESASLGCRFVTAVRAVVHQARTAPGQWLAVHGCGGVGLSAIMIASALGARVIAVDTRDEALTRARQLGAEHLLNPQRDPIVPTIQDLTSGGAHVSIDALGSRATCRDSIACLAKRGRHVQVGLMLAEDREALVPMNQVIAKELELYGSHGMAARDYGAVFAMIQDGRLKPHLLLGKTIPLSEAPAELAAMGQFNTQGITVINRF